MSWELVVDRDTVAAILDEMQKDPVSFRHVYGVIDPEHSNVGPNDPSHELYADGAFSLLKWTTSRVCCIWDEPNGPVLSSLIELARKPGLNELTVLGYDAFRALKPVLTDGQWRYSRNYGVSESEFRPKPLSSVRKLSPEDKGMLEKACADGLFGTSASTMRDFNYMANGLPFICCGAFAGEQLAGFCSANPICRGVREISWIVVAEAHRRNGFASALLSAQAVLAFADGESVGYHAGGAGDDLHAMLLSLGFHEVRPTYRFIPAASDEQWRTFWGKTV